MTNQNVIELVTEVYVWFNQILDPSNPFQKKDLEKYFTPDFIMDLSDNIMTDDYDKIFDHFEKWRQSRSLLKAQLPFKEIFVSEDGKRCVVRYSLIEVPHNDSDKNQEMKVIAIWHVSEDGRFQRMNQVVFCEGDVALV